MALAAVLFSILTVLFGTVALGEVATPSSTSAVRVLVAGHLLLAFSGVVLLLVAAVAASQGVAWGSGVVLIAAAAFGLATLLRSRRRPSRSPATGTGEGGPAGPAVPPVVVIVHGAAATVTIILVLLTAIRVGRA